MRLFILLLLITCGCGSIQPHYFSPPVDSNVKQSAKKDKVEKKKHKPLVIDQTPIVCSVGYGSQRINPKCQKVS